jgi:GNAT superfamily N-acetyltransferase
MKVSDQQELANCAQMIRESITILNQIEHFDDQPSIEGWVRNAVYDLVTCDYACTAHDEGGFLCGVAALRTRKECRLLVLYVHPAYKKAGVGGALLGMMQREAKAHGYKAMKVFSSFLAQKFYLKHGFVHDGVPEKGVGLTWNYPMIKKLG